MIAMNSTADGKKPRFSCGRGQVAGRGAERERREHRRPVEALAAAGGDAVDRERALAAVPAARRSAAMISAEQRRRDRVGDARAVMDRRRPSSCRRSRPSSPRTSRYGAWYSRWRSCSHSAKPEPEDADRRRRAARLLPRKSDIDSPMPVVRSFSTQKIAVISGTLASATRVRTPITPLTVRCPTLDHNALKDYLCRARIRLRSSRAATKVGYAMPRRRSAGLGGRQHRQLFLVGVNTITGITRRPSARIRRTAVSVLPGCG